MLKVLKEVNYYELIKALLLFEDEQLTGQQIEDIISKFMDDDDCRTLFDLQKYFDSL